MKLLVQADDYAISRAVSLGILHGIKNGLIRNTGMFVNMPWSEECAEWIRPYLDQIAFGIYLNLTTGSSVLGHERIPSITKEDNSFYTSWESRKMDAENGEHASDEEVEAEFEAQIGRFIEITGKKPDYIHAHAYATDAIMKIQRKLAEKYGVPYSSDTWEKWGCPGLNSPITVWYKKPATLENQAATSLKDHILEHIDEWNEREYMALIGHMGYVDQDLMKLTTYTLYRMTDLEGVTDPEVLKAVNDRNIELITYKDIH